MRSIVRLFAFGAFAAATLPSGHAAAQLPSIDARTFQPSTDPAASLSLEPVAVAPKWSFGTATFLHYGYRPITVRRSNGDVDSRPLEHVFGGDFVASFGLPSSSIGVALPYAFAQTGDGNLSPRVSATSRAPLAAIGDISLEGKAPFVTYDTAGFGMGMRARLTLPTGDRTSFMGAGTSRVELRLLAEYSLILASVHASVGYVSRFDQTTWPAVTGATIGDEIPWSFGFRGRPKLLGVDPGDRQTWELAVRGALPAGPAGPFGSGEPGSAVLSPVILGASDRIALGESRDVFAIAGVDVGLDTALGVPAVRGIVGLGFMPREHDQDRDGVRDDRDECPEIPEDRDGYEDGDGCPEVDNDDDGVLDREDACPLVPGVEMPGPRNGCAAPDGDRDGVPDASDVCPDRAGPPSDNPRLTGCPHDDKDGDGVFDAIDRCPNAPEDKDGNADDDGCPDEDDDGDGVPDRSDACPKERGEPSSDPTRNGCAVHDRDGDAIDDGADKCPDEAEVYNGVTDDDGCADTGGAPLVRIVTNGAKTTVSLTRPLKWSGTAADPSVDSSSLSTLRALALELSRHRDWTLTVGARATSAKEPDVAVAQSRALAVAKAVRTFAHRDSAAEVVAWDAVKAEPNAAANGIGFGIVVSPAGPPAAGNPTHLAP